ncbi:Type II secretion envelope pseudopilin protein (PulG,guides folded protein to PulD in outer membrane) [hydrothermal vent metagenome]|uniref:Type II secretion envelope pseudopilin protein (PulG,guides folded protein to PulD in outer membrane) n=1 Tax=hydrothermal vent metagenome TaxID=652676 RepID=A0A1W1CCE2_9ZZZZ
MTKAFTMVELVFAIVIIGILASVAVPKLAATRDDAEITSARTAISALRTAIATERQKRILRGVFTDITITEALALLSYPLGTDWTALPTSNQLLYTGPSTNQCIFKLQANRLNINGTCAVIGMSDL